MLIVITNNYPEEGKPYQNGFIHSRMLYYLRNGIDAQVFVMNAKKKHLYYIYEGVSVEIGDEDNLMQLLLMNPYADLCVHFINGQIINVLNKIENSRRLVVFVHGVEALHWYERIFPGTFRTPKMILSFLHYIKSNIHQINICRKFFSNTIHKVEFIAVSEWMKDIAERNYKCKGKYVWHIIPNYIDDTRFPYKKKKPEQAKSMLSIRQFSTGKYANDITVKFIQDLKTRLGCDNYKVTFVGDGPLYDSIMKPILDYPNVTFERRMIPQNEIGSFHETSGLFICPTRQDAQGVSMCEAMSSGLVPITLCNTAIPEFLPDDKRLRCNTVSEMEDLAIRLIQNPIEFEELSIKCSEYIRRKCGSDNTTELELRIISGNY